MLRTLSDPTHLIKLLQTFSQFEMQVTRGRQLPCKLYERLGALLGLAALVFARRSSAVFQLDGTMIDSPILRRAQRMLGLR